MQMSYADLLHCLTPYNNAEYNNSAEEYLKDITPSIFEFADNDRSGTIDYSEFFFFMSLMQISEKTVRRAFKDANKQGIWTKEDIKERLPELLLKSAGGSKQQEKVKIDARAVKVTKEDLIDDIERTADRIF